MKVHGVRKITRITGKGTTFATGNIHTNAAL